MTFGKLALQSLLDRKGSVVLALFAMTISIFVLLGVEHIRHQAKSSFANTVSGVDLIVGARTGGLNLLLYSVFRIGSPTNNIRWDTYQSISNNSKVKWAIPMSLGDSHKGYRVLGTTKDYFKHFSYGAKHPLEMAEGIAFDDLFEVVLGAQVAKQLGYKIGDKITLSHGIAKISFSRHDDMPFKVVGILKPTGTPVDGTLHVSLQAIEAIHIGWQQGVKLPGLSPNQRDIEKLNIKPKNITAFMLGLNSKMAIFKVQRQINEYRAEPLMAILPGVALSELWQMMNILENALILVSALVFVSACLGVSAMLLSSVRERRKEIHLLRVIGAPPYFVFLLIELEALLITLLSIVLGALLLLASLLGLKEYVASYFGLHIQVQLITTSSIYLISATLAVSLIVAAIPAIMGYRRGCASQ